MLSSLPSADDEPTQQEIDEYADSIGIDANREPQLMWIARQGISAPMPSDEWRPVESDTGELYFYNFKTKQSLWEHPSDEHYRQLVIDERAKIMAQRPDNAMTSVVERSSLPIGGRLLPIVDHPMPHPHRRMPMLKDVILPATDLDDESQQPPADGETNATTPNQQSTLLNRPIIKIKAIDKSSSLSFSSSSSSSNDDRSVSSKSMVSNRRVSFDIDADRREELKQSHQSAMDELQSRYASEFDQCRDELAAKLQQMQTEKFQKLTEYQQTIDQQLRSEFDRIEFEHRKAVEKKMDELKQNYELRVHEEEESYERRLADIRGENDAKLIKSNQDRITESYGNPVVMQDRASSPVLTMGDNQESLFDDRLNRLNALIDQMNEKLELHPGRLNIDQFIDQSWKQYRQTRLITPPVDDHDQLAAIKRCIRRIERHRFVPKMLPNL